ncbi:2-aminoethylphosphonate--pyruvate transaminase [Lacticaseibacillus saniviri]|nr:2-aminoethylphosphonate--pyruvate transaminase [Lacticaseibacillus saniviri]
MPLIEIYNQQQAALLLTPGPLTTSLSVKNRMLVDHGTWDDDYKALTQDIRQQLLAVGHADAEQYSTILMQGSGSFGVESVLQTAVPNRKGRGTLLIAINGAYGQRMAEMADHLAIDYLAIDFGETEPANADVILEALTQHPEITHFAMVHCETTTGLLNDLSVIPMLNALGVVTIVDAMSSFGGVPINIDELHVDYLISSANKCIQGVPGFAFVIANRETLMQTAGNATSLSLDLYEQWRSFEDYAGKWRFTSPTHTVYAFHQALHELQQEGGVTARFERYQDNQARLRLGMRALGFDPLLPETLQSPIITSFKYPTPDFDFMAFYRALKDQGFIIYPGKIAAIDSFRIGNIGEVYAGDISRLLTAVASIMDEAPVLAK